MKAVIKKKLSFNPISIDLQPDVEYEKFSKSKDEAYSSRCNSSGVIIIILQLGDCWLHVNGNETIRPS